MGAETKLSQALAYAKCGRAIFPVHWLLADGRCSCGDPACPSPGSHPLTPNAFQAATTDPERIKRWWGKLPEANIGLDIRGDGRYAPRILRYIMDCGGRAKQSDIFRYALGGNVEAREMLRELVRYEADDVLGREQADGGTPGRPATWWFLRSYVSPLGVPGNGPPTQAPETKA